MTLHTVFVTQTLPLLQIRSVSFLIYFNGLFDGL